MTWKTSPNLAFFFFLHLNLEWANVLGLGWHSVTVIEKTIVSKGYFIENSIWWQYFRWTFEINNPHHTDFASIFSQFSCSPWDIFDMFFHENMYIVPYLYLSRSWIFDSFLKDSVIFATVLNGCVVFHQVNHPIFKYLCHHLDNSRCFCFYLSSVRATINTSIEFFRREYFYSAKPDYFLG